MIVCLEGTITNDEGGDEIKVEVHATSWGNTAAKNEEIVNDLAAKLARKLLAARVA